MLRCPYFRSKRRKSVDLQQAAFLIQEVNPMNWLRFSDHGLKEAKRSEGSQRIRAQAESGTQRLQRRCLLIDFHVPP